MRVVFPAETNREEVIIPPFTKRALVWSLAGAIAGLEVWHHIAVGDARFVLTVAVVGIGLAAGFVEVGGAPLPTWGKRAFAFLGKPKRFVYR